MKTILLFSGGIDSLVAYHYLGKPPTVYFNLGTPYSEKELQVVRKLIPETIIEYDTIDLGSRQIGEKAYVPFRNLILACLAYKYGNHIVIAGVKDDDVSDKNESIFRHFSDLLTIMESIPIKISSPFWQMTKEDVVGWYLRHGGNIQTLLSTISCYSEEDTNYCGKCPSCFRKWCALRANGIYPPFFNDILMQEYYARALDGHYSRERNENIIRQVEMYRRG